ncbi:MAG: outer membrane protein [Terriglobia bacterium]
MRRPGWRYGALVLLASGIAAFGCGRALAGDWGGSLKDDRAADAGSRWQGLYAGIHAGLATGDVDSTSLAFPASVGVTGGLYGGQIGYNWQKGATVYGLEASWSGSNIEGNSQCGVVFTCSREVNWMATVTGKAGWAMGRSLLYGYGGVAWADMTATGSILGFTISGSETHVGWTAGFGLEHALSNRLSFKIEYAHVDLGDETHILGNGGPVIAANVDGDLDVIRLGVNYKLNN